MRDNQLTIVPGASSRQLAYGSGRELTISPEHGRDSAWLFLATVAGLWARVLVWACVFVAALFALFTYPALLLGGFLAVALLVPYMRRTRD